MSVSTRLSRWLKHRRNLRQIESVGSNTEIWGDIDRRSAGARIAIGSGSRIAGSLVAEGKSRLKIGRNSFVGPSSIVECALEIEIGDDVIISEKCILSDSDNHDGDDHASAPIKIRNGAWIGARAIIFKGVTVGEGAVIGMGSTVTKDVAPFTLVAGNPARVIRALKDR